MRKIMEVYKDAVGPMLADAGLALASVRIDNMSTGEPAITVFFPKSQHGPDFAYIKDALREHYVIVRFSSPDGREFVEVAVNHEDALSNLERPKKKLFSSENVT
jgi:hypothetical protein